MRLLFLVAALGCNAYIADETDELVDTESIDTDSLDDTDPPDDTDSPDDTDEPGLAEDLAENWKLWSAQGIDDYSFVLTWGCFCPDHITGPANIVVVDGVVTSATYVEDDSPVQDTFDARTLESLFDFIEDELESAEAVQATFDELLGYPTSAASDRIIDADDDEIAFTVLDFASGS